MQLMLVRLQYNTHMQSLNCSAEQSFLMASRHFIFHLLALPLCNSMRGERRYAETRLYDIHVKHATDCKCKEQRGKTPNLPLNVHRSELVENLKEQKRVLRWPCVNAKPKRGTFHTLVTQSGRQAPFGLSVVCSNHAMLKGRG